MILYFYCPCCKFTRQGWIGPSKTSLETRPRTDLYNTLIVCLPNESKEILSKNGIITSILASPTFNFTSFCKVLLVDEVNEEIGKLFKINNL